MSQKILYLSYTGMMEPLGASQVLNYLEGLSDEYSFHLVSLEKMEDFTNVEKRRLLKKRLLERNIIWYPLPYKFGAINYLRNFLNFFNQAKKIVIENEIKLIHCRSYIPCLAAYLLKKKHNINYLFDTRGFWFDEKADLGRWNKNGLSYKWAKKLERKLYQKASATVMLSEKSRKVIENDELFIGGSKLKNIFFIPTCTDLHRFQPNPDFANKKITIGYVGTAAGWYNFDKAAELLKEIRTQVDFDLKIYNGNEHAYIKRKLGNYGFKENEYVLAKVPFSEMPSKVNQFDLSIFFIHPYFSKNASAATKLGELMASGVPVLTNKNVGDHEALIEKYKVGKILDIDKLNTYDYKQIIGELVNEQTKKNCRRLAEEVFSLDKGIEKYREIYRSLVA